MLRGQLPDVIVDGIERGGMDLDENLSRTWPLNVARADNPLAFRGRLNKKCFLFCHLVESRVSSKFGEKRWVVMLNPTFFMSLLYHSVDYKLVTGRRELFEGPYQ